MIFRKKRLSVDDMIALEEKLTESPLAEIGFGTTDEELADILIVVLNEKELPKNTKAVLCPSDNSSYFGCIKVNEKYRNNLFTCIPEIVRYVFDIGIGNYVNRTFERK